VKEDPLLPSVLSLPGGSDLHAHELVTSGCVLLQGRSSCMPAAALGLREGWTCLDACAAPGNKTTHAAALVGPSGRVLAFDRDAARLKTLERNAATAGAAHVEARCQDFLSLDPGAPEYAGVRAVLLDPSCSGSGTGGTRMDWLMPSERERARERAALGGDGDDPAWTRLLESDAHRVHKLSQFQRRALEHALSFPGAVRVAYSTCSVYARENEEVVESVLPAAREAGWRLARALPGWPRRGLGRFAFGEDVVRVHPTEDGTDGFFVAVFERDGGSGEEAEGRGEGKRARDAGDAAGGGEKKRPKKEGKREKREKREKKEKKEKKEKREKS